MDVRVENSLFCYVAGRRDQVETFWNKCVLYGLTDPQSGGADRRDEARLGGPEIRDMCTWNHQRVAKSRGLIWKERHPIVSLRNHRGLRIVPPRDCAERTVWKLVWR